MITETTIAPIIPAINPLTCAISTNLWASDASALGKSPSMRYENAPITTALVMKEYSGSFIKNAAIVRGNNAYTAIDAP
ncbi:hypothetical protein LR1_15340 [Lacticaseibacillus rhamnosus DSM 20021 = JCM 1136 = NBRC 3425]|nr:hypothetical protein LR1_15340 [Lacticaseibacillus rhamnosus DSM 20021 = JCM 1136 = NBRC 3425]